MDINNSILLQVKKGECLDVASLVKDYIVTGCDTEILSIIWNAKLLGKVDGYDLSNLPEEDTTLLKKEIIRSVLTGLVDNRYDNESIELPSYFELGDDQLIATNRIIIADDNLKKGYLVNEWMKSTIFKQIIYDRIEKEELSQLIDDMAYFVENLHEESSLGEFCILLENKIEETYGEDNASVKILYILYSVLAKCRYGAKYLEIKRLIACILETVDKSTVIESQSNTGGFEFIRCGIELLDISESIIEKIKVASSCIVINDLWVLTEGELCKQLGLTEDELTVLLNEMEKIALITSKKTYIYQIERCKELQKRMYRKDISTTVNAEKYFRIRFNDRRGNNWLIVQNCREGDNLWYGREFMATAFALHLFVENNILTRFLQDKNYEKIIVGENDVPYYYADNFFECENSVWKEET